MSSASCSRERGISERDAADVANDEAEIRMRLAAKHDGGNLDVDRPAVLAAHDAGEQLERPVLAQVQEQDVEIDARLADPAIDALAVDTLLAVDLRELQERGVGMKQAPVVIRQHESVRSIFDEPLHLQCQVGLGRHHGSCRYRREAQQKERGEILPEEQAVEYELLPAAEAQSLVFDPRLRAKREGDALGCGRVVDRQDVGKQFADQMRRAFIDQNGCGGIRFHDAVGRGVDDQHRFGIHLEQDAVTRFNVPHSRIVAFDRDLRLDQLLLERGGRAPVAPDGDLAPLIPDRDHGKEERNVGPAGRRTTNLTPSRNPSRGGLFQHLLDLDLAFLGDRRLPGPADPLICVPQLEWQLRALEGDILNDAVAVESQRDIGGGGDQCRRGVSLEIAQRFFWMPESLDGHGRNHLPSKGTL